MILAMGWLETIILAIVLVAGGLYLLLALAIIVTAMVERRSVKPLVPADPDDPEWQKLGPIDLDHASSGMPASSSDTQTSPGALSYAESRIRAASRLGFSTPRLFKYFKGGIYQTRTVLALSPSRETLAVMRWGTTALIRDQVTTLYSALEDGRYLVTSDRPTGARTPGFYDDLIFLDANMDQLVARHEERLRAFGQTSRQFSADNPLAELETILARRIQYLVEQGDACWLNPERTTFRSTLKGALKTFSLTFSTKDVVDRSLVGAVR